MQTITITEQHKGVRADKALAELMPEHSRSRITDAIKSGEIKFNDSILLPKTKLTGGELVTITLVQQTIDNKPQDIDLNVIYSDDDVIVINKQAGLTVHPGAGCHDGTMLNGLLYHFPELQNIPRAGIVHRLDKDTTGVLVVARSNRAHTTLIEQLQDRTMQREYLALTHGEVISGFSVDKPIGRCPRNRTKMAVGIGKEAVTHARIFERFSRLTLLKVRLETGRTHQIRVHLSDAGYPIVGDQTYHSRAFVKGYAPDLLANFKRQALHAYKLSFTHPNGRVMNFKAKLPDDFTDLLDEIRSHPANAIEHEEINEVWEEYYEE